jgi:nucleotide-binding universal stress UspA family protein
MTASIIVGFDGSPPACAALGWAAREAALRHASVEIVHSWPWPLHLTTQEMDFVREAQRLVAEGAARIREIAPEVDVTTDIVADTPVAALMHAAGFADLLVVGVRPTVLGGSVAAHLAGHAPCPVVLVPAETAPPAGAALASAGGHSAVPAQQIVVGIAGSAPADAELGAAFAEADLRRGRLTIVHSWRDPLPTRQADLQPFFYTSEAVLEQETRLVSEVIAGWRTKYPDVDVLTWVEEAHTRRLLIELAADADLMVLGAHREDGPHLMALGSVTRSIVHHVSCPILITRPR